MEKYRIAWITSGPFLDTDIYIVPELNAFYAIDWYVTRKKTEKLDYDLAEFRAKHPSVDVTCVELGQRNRSAETFQAYAAFLREIKKKQYDMVYVVHDSFPFFMPLVRLILGSRKTVAAIHNVTVPKGEVIEKCMKLYTGFVLKTFRHFHVFSESQCQVLQQKTASKSILYAPFVLKDYGAPTKVRGDLRITFLNFGNIREYKRIDVLIDAAQAAYEQTGILFRVILAGSCTQWEQYQRRIRYPQLFDLRIGRVENEQMPDLFEESDYFVAPYQDIAQSGSVIVAINYNKPIIASDLEAFREYIQDGENGYLIKPADVAGLTQTMVEVLETHESRYAQMSENQAKIKETKFSVRAICAMYRAFFDKICRL